MVDLGESGLHGAVFNYIDLVLGDHLGEIFIRKESIIFFIEFFYYSLNFVLA